ncbi:MAG: alpha/beta hydrolase [Myxococcales bacterium]|nr:alpha/beta hydrolase [Myxococcales bacterium]
MALARYRDVTAGGARLRVADTGSGSPVVLLHGMFMDHHTWSRVTPEFEEDFRIITPDLPGFGESEKPPPSRFGYGFDAFADCVAGLYAGLGVGRAALVGHDLGGSIAIAIAARHPELVSRLVVINPTCFVTKADYSRRLAAWPLLGGLMFKQFLGRTSFRSYFRERLTNGAPIESARLDHYYDCFNTPAGRGSALATLRATEDTRPIIADTARVAVPSLVVWGRHDKLCPSGFGQKLSRNLNNAGFELMNSGHSPQEERPTEVGRVLRGFLKAERASMF